MLWYGCTKSIAHISQFCRLNFIHLQCCFLTHIYKWFVFYLIVFLKASYGVLRMNSFLASLVLNVGRWGRMNSARNPSREVWAQDLTWSLRYVLWQNTLLSQCISPPRDISEYLRIVREAWWIAWGWTGIPIQGGGLVLLVASHDGNRVKLPGHLALVQNLSITDITCVSITTGKQFSL